MIPVNLRHFAQPLRGSCAKAPNDLRSPQGPSLRINSLAFGKPLAFSMADKF
jgi:hypothetical protein